MLRPKPTFSAWLLTLALSSAAFADGTPTPAGPVLPVEGHPAELHLRDNVFFAPGGDYVEVTSEPTGDPALGVRVFGQRFSSDGTPRGERFLVDTTEVPLVQPDWSIEYQPGIFVDNDRFIISWIVSFAGADEDVYFRLFEGAGTALTEPTRTIRSTFTISYHLAALSTDRFVNTITTDTGSLQVDLAEFQVVRTDGSVVAVGRAGREIPDPYPCVGQFNELVLGLETTATGGFQAVFYRSVSESAPPACRELPPGLFLGTFNADGVPLGPEIKLSDDFRGASEAELIEGHGWLITSYDGPDTIEGRWFSVEGEPLGAPFQIGTRLMKNPLGQEIAQTLDGEIVVSWRDRDTDLSELKQRLRALEAACTPGPTTLCLGGGRFRVDVDWLDFRDRQGSGSATPLSDETGYFTFFNGDNVELVVKVLDGQPRNSNFWVFYGALSNVRYRITVTDTERGLQKVYDNPAQNFASTGDTAAFPGDGGGVPIQGESLAPAEIAALLPGIPTDGPGLATAGESTEELSFHGGRFRASTTWRDFLDRTGTGQGTMLTDDTGYFWFFRPENVELVVKVLDGRANNGHWWVFYGALSNVEYSLAVEDTETGTANEYFNPLRTFASDGDTTAFPE